MAEQTVSAILKAAGYSKTQRQKMTLEEALPILGVDPSYMQTLGLLGFSPQSTLQDFFKQTYNTGDYDFTVAQIGEKIASHPAMQSPQGGNPGAVSPIPGPRPEGEPLPTPGTAGPSSLPQEQANPEIYQIQGPSSLLDLLSGSGLGVSASISDALSAMITDPQELANAQMMFQRLGVDPMASVGSVMQAAGLTGSETLEQAGQRLSGLQSLDMPSSNQFPQVPGIQLPAGLQPQPFQMPGQASLPGDVSMPPELQSLLSSIQSSLGAQQGVRDDVLAQLRAGIDEQQANARANQPMLDAAMANINSVLTGQAMSPGLEGLINAAFAPAEAEGQRKLRQIAEETAAARGMSLTDTPIGQPFLEENRRFLEQMGGQRAQMGAQLREQDAAFSQNIRAFQEGLKQQALTNQTQVLQSLGTPEQAASVLSNLGLGARNSAVQEFGIRSQAALGASDQALRAALGQASANQANSQLALASQAQNFGQQFQQQQASIQNQMAMMGLLGDPFGAYGSFGSMGSNLANLPLMNNLNLIGSLAGNPVAFNPAGQSGGGGGAGGLLGGLGSLGMGLGSILGAGGSSGLGAALGSAATVAGW